MRCFYIVILRNTLQNNYYHREDNKKKKEEEISNIVEHHQLIKIKKTVAWNGDLRMLVTKTVTSKTWLT